MVMLRRSMNEVGIYCFKIYTFLISSIGPKMRKPMTELIGNRVLKDLPIIASDVEQIEKKNANTSKIGIAHTIGNVIPALMSQGFPYTWTTDKTTAAMEK